MTQKHYQMKSDTSSTEPEQSFTAHSDQQLQSDDEHSITDYKYSPVPTISPPGNTEDAVITPPTPCPRHPQTCQTPLQRPSKIMKS